MAGSEAIEILLVEDNPADAELTLHALQKSKLANKIYHAKDGEEALDFLFCRGAFSSRRFDEAPRMVLLDLKLPKIDGLEVLQELKSDARTKAIPVIVLTTSKEERDMVSSYKNGVNSYIQKPVSVTDFQEVVRQWECTGSWLIASHLLPLFQLPTAQPTNDVNERFFKDQRTRARCGRSAPAPVDCRR